MEQYTILAEFYDKFNSSVDYAAIKRFIEELLKENKIGKTATLLDLACGTGRLTNLFAEDGYDMIGVDLSAEMLSVAREESEKKGLSPLYLCQNMCSLDLYGTVDAAFSCLDSLNYLSSTAELSCVFARLYNFIAPNGLFIFDVNTKYKFEHIYGENTYVYDEDSVFCVWQNFYNKKRGICDFLLTFFTEENDGVYTRLEETQREKYFSHRIIKSAAEKNGFELLSVFSDTDRGPLTDKSEKAYYVMRRKPCSN